MIDLYFYVLRNTRVKIHRLSKLTSTAIPYSHAARTRYCLIKYGYAQFDMRLTID